MNPLPFSLWGEGIGDGDFTVGGVVSMTGFNSVGVTALGPCKMAPWLKFGATLKGFRGVESAVNVVESPGLAGKITGGLVFISSGLLLARSGAFNCCLKVRYLFCS